MASAQLDPILELGRAGMIEHLMVCGINALWFYDYFLTLSDEIEYIWSRRNRFVLMLFIANRYWPVWYLVWISVAFWVPQFTPAICDKTKWFPMLYFIFATAFAQTAISLRIYAVTGNNRWIASYLSFISFGQFVFGTFLLIHFSLRPAMPLPDIPLDEFRLCSFQRWRVGEIIFVALSLLYDVSAFGLIIWSAKYRGFMRARGVPNLLDRIVQDSTTYFLVIFTNHLVLILFELFAAEAIQLLPANGMVALMPLMVTRLILSLKKAGSPQETTWDANGRSVPDGLRFAPRTIGGSDREGVDIALKHFSSDEDSTGLTSTGMSSNFA